MNEQLSTIEKLHSMQRGNVHRFTRDDMRILKTLDRSNEIRTRPVPPSDGVDGETGWEAWLEFQTVHDADLQQVTGRLPAMTCATCSGTGKNKAGLTCGKCNGIGALI